jgi:hypothetical protein
LDETGINTKNLILGKIWKKKNSNINTIINNDNIKYNMILSLRASGIYYRIYENKFVNQFTFLDYITRCIQDKFLKNGSILILDNYGIHSGAQIFTVLRRMLKIHNIRILFLPW